MTGITFQTPEEARAWDMYACANIGCGGWDMMFECADMMLLERRKRMAPEKVAEAANTKFEQRVSFVYGSLPEHTTLTKDDVRRMLKEQGS